SQIHTLSLHDALPIYIWSATPFFSLTPQIMYFSSSEGWFNIAIKSFNISYFLGCFSIGYCTFLKSKAYPSECNFIISNILSVIRSEEHTSELQSRENL